MRLFDFDIITTEGLLFTPYSRASLSIWYCETLIKTRQFFGYPPQICLNALTH